MEPGFWHERWHKQQIGFHQQDINPFLVKYWSTLALRGNEQVFVPLCGKSLDMCYLAEKGHDLLGCELSELAVRQFFEENGLEYQQNAFGELQAFSSEQMTLLQGDLFALKAEQLASVGAFYDRAALIAWPEEMRLQYAAKLAALLPRGRCGLLVTLEYPQDMLKGPPFSVTQEWIREHMSQWFEVTLLEQADVLADNPRFIAKEVSWLNESAYLLKRK
ncbi:thiopurine S-methyltransferase [Shewanella algae]|uniref:thiopurine S-methyltransferase n=1 Tax=Shewanella algae TaxID=38313 RepID=UPI00101FAB28|nr:thiopurine S-methyltransferase [Shewanella algae]MBO2555403.1 thiopurine S-methyltransferase [Shewanella algae]MBO2572337.1 thiopurine S-methyltransferase [Shewanella algae]MBO2644246.1 thiopurine S-methyltransferase [Shewanella algae]TVL07001.1 thiopurine S-methyltransferase [Shewanella algae]TVO83183.1 thiopurine S-methyltransferase [Shewanella algae]